MLKDEVINVLEHSIRTMTDDERNKFLQLEAEAWRG